MKRNQKVKAWILYLGSLVLCVCVAFVGRLFVQIESTEYIGDEEIPLAYNDPSLVLETDEDIRVIPDKYNTGAKGELTKVELGDKVGEIQLKVDGTGTKNTLGFYYSNKTVSGTVVIENMDFSKYPLLIYHSEKLTNAMTIVFNNCKFSVMSTGKFDSKISYEFNNCTFQRFTGSDATFTRCKFGDSYSDGIVPFQNILVQDCFISNMSVVKTEEGELHSDGTHLYGHADAPLYNVTYDNCRFEIPAIELTESNAYVNACFMLQLEYNDASDITVSNCILNGGGYSIYAGVKGEFSMENVLLQNVRVGCAKKFGIFYPTISNAVVRENITETDSLYVASVWKEKNETHFSVTNDTNQERELLILTDKGQFSYTIPACPIGKELTVNGRYEDLPFDIDIVLPVDCEYAVCYDTFISGAAKQIRFVNWTGNNVYLTEEEVEELFSAKSAIWQSGQCGDDTWFELDATGVLTLSGTGATYNYHSAKRAPWYDYREFIKEVIVEEGVTGLGAQLFIDCASVQNITLPEGILSIGQRSFYGCVAPISVYWPSDLKSLGKQAFRYSFMETIEYAGTDIADVEIDEGDIEDINSILKYVTIYEESEEIIEEGDCGKECTYTLYNDGTLLIAGTGEMYNYHSLKTAPWYENKEEIYLVIIEEGIQKIGSQAFRKCSNLCDVVFPDSLVCIGANAFIGCSSLSGISLPNGIEEIQARAFSDVDIFYTYYAGTEEQWNSIKIGKKNECIEDSVIFEE